MSIIPMGKDKNGIPVWKVIVSSGSGKERHRPSKTIHGTKAEAKRTEREMEAARDTGLRFDAQRVTFTEFATDWAEQRAAAGVVTDSTGKATVQRINVLCGYLGRYKLKDINAQMIERTYSQIRKDRGITNSTLSKYHITLRQVLQRACDYDLILRNPCDKVEAPRPEKHEAEAISVERFPLFVRALNMAEKAEREAYDGKEQRQIERGKGFGRQYVRNLSTLSCIMAARLDLGTGMRRGEVLALTWADFDPVRCSASVNQALDKVTGKTKPPKSESGRRLVSVDADTAAKLMEWKRFQGTQLRKVGVTQTERTPMFCNSSGDYMNPNNYSRWWRDFRREAEFSDLQFKSLRHTQATYLLGNGADIKTVQTRLGHANASVTLNIYAHALPQNDEQAAAIMGNMIAAAAVEKPPIAASF